MGTKTSQLIVELLDRVSAPAKQVAGSLSRLRGGAAGQVSVQQRLDGALARTNTRLEEARSGIVDAVGAYYTLRAAVAAPMAAAAAFETQLEDIGQKAGIPAENLAALGGQITEIARRTNQAASEVAAGVDALVGRGASIETALAVADPIGKAAVAYRAATEDLAATAMVATDNLKIPAEQMGGALDILAQAGKEGAFELADMAKSMPSIAAQYAAMGQTGVGALADIGAAAQVMRKDTGTSAEAATRLENVMQKTYSPATIKIFAAAGVDLMAEMQKAAERGLTPLEAIAEITQQTLGGDLSKIGTLFEDKEAQAGIRSLVQHSEEFRRIRAAALKAQGTVAADYERRIKTAAGATLRWQATLETLNVTVGNALLPLMSDVLDKIVPILARVGDWIAANPKLVSGLVLATAGLIAFKGALAALRFAGLMSLSGGLTILAGGMNTVGRAAGGAYRAASASVALQAALARMDGSKIGLFTKIGAALRGLAAVTGLTAIKAAIAGVATVIAAISAPVWLGIAAAVAAVGLAWKYWDRISAVLSGVGQAIGEILAPALDKVRPVLDWFAPLGDVIAAGWGKAVGAIKAVGEWLGTVFKRETLSEEDKASAKQSGYDFVMAIWDGMKEVMADLLGWLKEKAAAILAPFSGLGAKVRGMFGAGDGGGGESVSEFSEFGGIDGARAGGGPVRRGRTYLVGEEGPELITPRADGMVHTARETRDMMAGTGGGRGGSGGRVTAPQISVNVNVSPSPGMDEEQLARRVASRIEESIGSALRGVQADTGMEAYG